MALIKSRRDRRSQQVMMSLGKNKLSQVGGRRAAEQRPYCKGRLGSLMGASTRFWMDPHWPLLCCATFSQAFKCLLLVLYAVMEGGLQKGKKGKKRVREAARISCRDTGCLLTMRKVLILILNIYVKKSPALLPFIFAHYLAMVGITPSCHCLWFLFAPP